MAVVKFGSLFSGIGGLDLGLERVGMSCAWQVEIDDYCQKVLAKHWPDVPKYRDIREVDFEQLRGVDLICGGFPCQDISAAGRRVGIRGSRSGLWTEYVRAIRQIRPQYVLVENVAQLLVRGLDVVLGDLAESGYDAEWRVLSACEFGAPHTRQRVFIVAYPHGDRRQHGRDMVLGNVVSPRREWEAAQGKPRWPLMERWLGQTFQAGNWGKSTPSFQRVDHGIPRRVDRLRGLGNAVVPQIAEWIGERIVEFDSR